MSRDNAIQSSLEDKHEELVREVTGLFVSLEYRMGLFKNDPTPEAASIVQDLAACIAEDMTNYMEWCDANE